MNDLRPNRLAKDSSSNTPNSEYSSPYCLHCYAPLGRMTGASVPCPACGRANLKADQQQLWTRERKLRELESLLKLAIALAMIGVGAMALLFPGTGVGRGHGMAIGTPIVVGILLWDLASITRRQTIFRADIIWPIIGWFLGLPFVWFTLTIGGMVSPRVQVTLLVLGVVVTIPAIFSPLLRRFWTRWCERHIARAQLHSSV